MYIADFDREKQLAGLARQATRSATTRGDGVAIFGADAGRALSAGIARSGVNGLYELGEVWERVIAPYKAGEEVATETLRSQMDALRTVSRQTEALDPVALSEAVLYRLLTATS